MKHGKLSSSWLKKLKIRPVSGFSKSTDTGIILNFLSLTQLNYKKW